MKKIMKEFIKLPQYNYFVYNRKFSLFCTENQDHNFFMYTIKTECLALIRTRLPAAKSF